MTNGECAIGDQRSGGQEERSGPRRGPETASLTHCEEHRDGESANESETKQSAESERRDYPFLLLNYANEGERCHSRRERVEWRRRPVRAPDAGRSRESAFSCGASATLPAVLWSLLPSARSASAAEEGDSQSSSLCLSRIAGWPAVETRELRTVLLCDWSTRLARQLARHSNALIFVRVAEIPQLERSAARRSAVSAHSQALTK